VSRNICSKPAGDYEATIEKRDVPESAFEVPDGHRAVSFADVFGMTLEDE